MTNIRNMTVKSSEQSNKDWEAKMALDKLSWEEATSDQKIEKLRNELLDNRYLQNRINQLQQEIQHLKNHSHTTNGTLVVPFHNLNTGVLVSGGLAKINDNLK